MATLFTNVCFSFILVFFFNYLQVCSSQVVSICTSATLCADCIIVGSYCSWCNDDDFLQLNPSKYRCDTLSNLTQSGCKNITIVNSDFQITKNDDLQDLVQVKPQEIAVQLRPGQPVKVKISIKPAPDYPVDLYLLMDVSNSMADDLLILKNLGVVLASSIKNITKNYRLGFGTFVDKNIIPFIQPEYRNFPCNAIKLSNCRGVFSYDHFFDFSQDGTQFQNSVAAQNISGTLNVPQGLFDALMQTTVCEQELNWRDKNTCRKIIVIVTDAAPKVGGDGKIGGIWKVNDAKCHMTKAASSSQSILLEYSAYDIYDYPSVFQLNQKLKEYQVVPIIAVTSDVMSQYQDIANVWKDLGTVIAELKSDSSNIVELIKNNYNLISSTVRLSDNSPDNFIISYEVNSTQCPSGSGNLCPNVSLQQQVDFFVSITAKTCPTDLANAPNMLAINIAGFGVVNVKVQYLCNCPCAAFAVQSSPKCSNGHGTFECGVCKCDSGYYGSICQCDSSSSQFNGTSNCQADPNNNSSLCSGYGSCICGQCVCVPIALPRKVTGKFCECRNFGCDLFEGKECGGDTRGACVCGQCVCNKGFLGSNCGSIDCNYNLQTKCTVDGVVCSGNGNCDCQQGGCNCNTGYSGTHCETCVTCPEICNNQTRQNCILCNNFKDEISYNKIDVNCTNCNLYPMINVTNAQQCSITLNSTCKIFYSITYQISNQLSSEITQVQTALSCAAALVANKDILPIVLGIVGGILLLGILLLLIWKLLVTLHDKKEFEKYTTGQIKSNWEEAENPIYQQAKQEFQNPVFAGN
uniref:Integrin beta n=1 Tax=Hydra vulgaris TaxID=6087 RepID=A0A0H5FPE0_HYDVU|nr:Integrin beta-3 [Hydra vulgaris]